MGTHRSLVPLAHCGIPAVAPIGVHDAEGVADTTTLHQQRTACAQHLHATADGRTMITN